MVYATAILTLAPFSKNILALAPFLGKYSRIGTFFTKKHSRVGTFELKFASILKLGTKHYLL